MTEAQKSYFRDYIPGGKLVEIDTIEDLAAQLPLGQSVADVVPCRSSQIIEGLLVAKFTRKRLVVDEGAPLLETRHLHGGEGVLVVENGVSVHEVAAINYAFSINADVVLVDPVDRQEIRELPRQLYAWSNDHSVRALDDVRRTIAKRIAGITFRRYKFATFFTVGLPYGLFIENIIPCTHVLKDVDCGVFIAENISDENAQLTFGSGLIFSPLQFASNETNKVARLLDASNYILKLLIGTSATVKQLDYYGGFFPFDVMHICSHGGETDGYYVICEFVDRQGEQHKLEYYEVVGFSPSGRDMVKVTTKAIFSSLDGFPWMSKPLKAYPKYVFEDMLKGLKPASDEEVRVKRTRVDHAIATSCHIRCYDSIHQGHFDSLAGIGRPIVFNNTCSSSHEMAATFIDAGARCYIGTLWSVGNETATQAAKLFYEGASRQGNLLAAFSEMSGSIARKKYRNVYILWGLHLGSFRKPSEKSEAKIREGLIATYFAWLNKVATAADPEVKRHGIPILRFLSSEIIRSFPKESLDKIENFDAGAINDLERSLPPSPEDDLSREIVETELASEERQAGAKAR